MPEITASLTVKKNLGNFENADIAFSITDSPREGENTKAAAERIYSLVELLVQNELDKYDTPEQ